MRYTVNNRNGSSDLEQPPDRSPLLVDLSGWLYALNLELDGYFILLGGMIDTAGCTGATQYVSANHGVVLQNGLLCQVNYRKNMAYNDL